MGNAKFQAPNVFTQVYLPSQLSCALPHTIPQFHPIGCKPDATHKTRSRYCIRALTERPALILRYTVQLSKCENTLCVIATDDLGCQDAKTVPSGQGAVGKGVAILVGYLVDRLQAALRRGTASQFSDIQHRLILTTIY